jgi:hypothetical protein
VVLGGKPVPYARLLENVMELKADSVNPGDAEAVRQLVIKGAEKLAEEVGKAKSRASEALEVARHLDGVPSLAVATLEGAAGEESLRERSLKDLVVRSISLLEDVVDGCDIDDLTRLMSRDEDAAREAVANYLELHKDAEAILGKEHFEEQSDGKEATDGEEESGG